MGRPLHSLTKAQIRKFALQKRRAGEYYDLHDALLDDTFHGSLDRFCDIAEQLRDCQRVLDVGAGHGLLLALLKLLGHEVHAVDFKPHDKDELYARHAIPFQVCNIEADPLPFEAESVDGLTCCQVLEHFTHSHLPPVLEMRRVLRNGGRIEIDVPNAAAFRNRSRMLRGKHITWAYREHYLLAKPIVYKGREYYPDRHNREFLLEELAMLLQEAQFREIDVRFLKSRRHREGLESLKSIGTALKDAVPSWRKTLIAFAVK